MARKSVVFVQLTHNERDITRARRLLKRIEKELDADWWYHDHDRRIIKDIADLAKALRAMVGPDQVQDTEQR